MTTCLVLLCDRVTCSTTGHSLPQHNYGPAKLYYQSENYRIILVLSKHPPIPTSMTATSTYSNSSTSTLTHPANHAGNRSHTAQVSRRCFTYFSLYFFSVLWCCWLGGRKCIRPVKNWVVGCWLGCLSGARCRLAYGPADGTRQRAVKCAHARVCVVLFMSVHTPVFLIITATLANLHKCNKLTDCRCKRCKFIRAGQQDR